MKFIYLALITILMASCSGIIDGFTPNPDFDDENSPSCGSQAIKLSWTAPTQREDDSPMDISEIYSYKILMGFEAGVYTDSVTVVNNMATSHSIDGVLADTDYYIVLTTNDTDGRESKYSTEILVKTDSPCTGDQKPRPRPKPKAPYEKPKWCNDSVELTFNWKTINKASVYESEVSYRRNGDVVEKRIFNPKELSFTETYKRGQNIYLKMTAKKRNRVIRNSEQTKFKVLSCKELEALRKKNSEFKEVNNIEVKWNKK